LSEEDAPQYETAAQAKRTVELLLRHMNGIVWAFQDNPETFDPLLSYREYENHEYLDGEAWAWGFVEGMTLCRNDWMPLLEDSAAKEAFRPIRLLAGENLSKEEEGLTRWPQQREDLAKQITASVASIYRFWLPHRKAVNGPIKRTEPKVGRNEPCPCGSGKKFKKCCGATNITLH
jgi:uncharacterized protein